MHGVSASSSAREGGLGRDVLVRKASWFWKEWTGEERRDRGGRGRGSLDFVLGVMFGCGMEWLSLCYVYVCMRIDGHIDG